ncbi:MAG: DUF2252 domain-containing protein, partial [Gammaproteobacteria bacterium]|nr:DUF2252 domain-containing protein [Gammaproteobacteria bacterium]
MGNYCWYHATDRRLVLDIGDFDETHPGPFEWDLKRLAASVMICARHNGYSGMECRSTFLPSAEWCAGHVRGRRIARNGRRGHFELLVFNIHSHSFSHCPGQGAPRRGFPADRAGRTRARILIRSLHHRPPLRKRYMSHQIPT